MTSLKVPLTQLLPFLVFLLHAHLHSQYLGQLELQSLLALYQVSKITVSMLVFPSWSSLTV